MCQNFGLDYWLVSLEWALVHFILFCRVRDYANAHAFLVECAHIQYTLHFAFSCLHHSENFLVGFTFCNWDSDSRKGGTSVLFTLRKGQYLLGIRQRKVTLMTIHCIRHACDISAVQFKQPLLFLLSNFLGNQSSATNPQANSFQWVFFLIIKPLLNSGFFALHRSMCCWLCVI